MILAICTSGPTCQMFLVEGKATVARKDWLAERRLGLELLAEIETFLSQNDTGFSKLSGLAVFKGPGSYTGLRIGASVMNALSYGLGIPIAGEAGEGWLAKAQKRLEKGANDTIVIPEYGGLPHTTAPKKP